MTNCIPLPQLNQTQPTNVKNHLVPKIIQSGTIQLINLQILDQP